jgi:hypothetical protein
VGSPAFGDVRTRPFAMACRTRGMAWCSLRSAEMSAVDQRAGEREQSEAGVGAVFVAVVEPRKACSRAKPPFCDPAVVTRSRAAGVR